MITEVKAYRVTDGTSIFGAKLFLDKEEAEVYEKQLQCPHKNIVKDDFHDGPRCSDCGKRFDGWFCPDSPDHSCHYFTEEDCKSVKLITGEMVLVPDHENHAFEYETEDECLFCGQPEERK